MTLSKAKQCIYSQYKDIPYNNSQNNDNQLKALTITQPLSNLPFHTITHKNIFVIDHINSFVNFTLNKSFNIKVFEATKKPDHKH
jgi:hypothetical protein